MPNPSLLLILLSLGQAQHDNPIFRDLVATGLTIEGTTLRLAEPSLADGRPLEAERVVLRSIAGDDKAVRDLVRDSVTAPFVLKTRDLKADQAVIRLVDLWFVVHAGLDAIDPDKALRQSDGQDVEVGNMRFGTKILTKQDLGEAKLEPLPPIDGRREWYTHATGRLLDRISVEGTDHAILTRSPDSILIASRTDPRFDRSERFPNRWSSLDRKAGKEIPGPARTYSGAISYVKITRLASEPGCLLVEAHMAFDEPLDWFQGNPILRSKLSVIAQDQVRRLRREIEKSSRKGVGTH